LVEDELTKLTLEPKQLVEDIATTTTALRERFGTALSAVRERAQETFGAFRGWLAALVGGYGEAAEAATAASLSQERYNQILAAGSAEGATLVQELTALVLRLSEASGEPFENIIQGMKDARQVSIDQGDAITQSLGIATGATQGLMGMLGSLGLKAIVFGAILAKVIGVIKDFVAEVRDAVAVSIEFQTSLVRLEIAIRAAQRFSGEMIGSISGWKSSLEELRQTYRGLSETDLQAAAARMILVTREMKFNEEQALRTLEAAVQLSTLYQVDLRRATSLVTQGLTGISRGLRLYGIQLSRAILNEQARALGLRRTWEELTAAERASVALEVITRQLSGTTEDLGHLYATLGGRLQEAEARLKDAKRDVGSLTAGFKVLGTELKARAIELLAKFIVTLEKFAAVAAGTIAIVAAFYNAIDKGVPLVEAMQLSLEAYAEAFMRVGTFFGVFREGLEDVEDLGGIWEALAADFQARTAEMLAVLEELAREYGARFADLEAELAARIDAAHRKLGDKLLDLDRELGYKRLDALRALYDKLADLATAFGRKQDDIARRTAEKLAKLRDDLNDKRAAILAALHKKLRRLQEDYQIASRRSRERFIEDLQDAVANRDAFAAVQLIKRQRREQRELKEDFGVKQGRAREDAAEALAKLKSDLEAQRKAILEEQKRALEDLDIWLARRREDAHRDYEERLEDLDLWLERQQRELEIAHEAELKELERHHRARQVELAAALAEEENITEAGARAIFEQLDAVFGLGGQIEAMMDAFRQRLNTRIEIEMRVNQIDVGDDIPPSPPWLPDVGLQDYGAAVPQSPAMPDSAQLQAAGVPSCVNPQTVTQLGVLEIQVSADEHFSEDFELMVGEQIADFVGHVIVRPRRA